MQDDNPLWYDYAEPDEPTGRMLLAVAGLFSMVLIVTAGVAQLLRSLNRLWR